MDRPIYLECLVCEGKPLRRRWYVIEERAGGDEEIAEEAEGGLKGWVRESKTDRFNRLHLPNLPVELDSNGLAVKDSRLFLIGGYHLLPVDSDDGHDAVAVTTTELMGFYSIDLNATNPEWRLTNLEKTDDDLMAVTDDTLVYIGSTGLGLVPRWDESPARLQLFRDLSFHPLGATVVALTETQLYIFHGTPGRVLHCDLKSRLWKTIDEQIWAPWSSNGVVMEDKYLLLFGSRGSDNVPGVYIYDIHSEKWLPKPVQGLPNDEISLPTLDPCGYGISYSFLMQVRRDEPKFAVVWSYEAPGSQFQVHWSKFIIHCTNRNNSPPFFFAEPLSHGGVCFGSNILLASSTT